MHFCPQVHSADDATAGRTLPLANAIKCTHGWYCCYDSFCVGGRMQELLFRVRFNFPKSANWDGMIPFSGHSSTAAVVVHFACYTLHDQRISSVTDRQSDLLNQPTSSPVQLSLSVQGEELRFFRDEMTISLHQPLMITYLFIIILCTHHSGHGGKEHQVAQS